MIERGLVVVRSRDRLKLELYVLKSGNLKCCSESAFRIAILLLRFRSDKSHRAAHHGLRNGATKLRGGLFPQIAQDTCDQFFQGIPPAKNVRALEAAAA